MVTEGEDGEADGATCLVARRLTDRRLRRCGCDACPDATTAVLGGLVNRPGLERAAPTEMIKAPAAAVTVTARVMRETRSWPRSRTRSRR
jgi:hypothetical protein